MAASASKRPSRSKTKDLRMTLNVRAKPDEIYKALTSARELCRWWLSGAETDARNGGRFRMVWPKLGRSDGRRAFPPNVALGESEGHFVDLEPGRKVAWLWKLSRRKVFPPLASFFIQRLKRGSQITLIHAGFPTREKSEKYFAGCAEGWEDCLAKLKLYLETGRSAKGQVLTLSRLRGLKSGSAN